MATLLLPNAACLGTPASPTFEQIKAIGDFYHRRDGFNGEIVVSHAGTLVADLTYGMANIELGVPLKPGMRFAIGSLTKQFTAAAILWLQDHGKLRITDRVTTYLGPDAPKAWADITLAQLLDHTSGIPDDVLIDAYPQFRIDPHTAGEVIRAVQDRPLKRPPGRAYDYTNVEYVILGAVIEKASGEAWDAFVRNHLLAPLKLDDTGVGGAPDIVKNRAFGYVPVDGKLKDAVTADPSVLGAAGAMYASGRDIATWVNALQHGKVLRPDTLKAMNTPHLENAGYGAFIERLNGVPVIGHGGDLPGFHTQTYYFPNTDDVVVVLSNVAQSNPKASPGAYAVTNELLELEADSHGVRPSSGQRVAVDPAVLAGRAGTYASPGTHARIRITRTPDSLVMAVAGQPGSEAPLNAETKAKFYATNRSMEVEFDGDRMILYQYANEDRSVWAKQP